METDRIGLFGGSFDPIHAGHLYLALQLQERYSLNEVWCFPATQAAFKEPIVASYSHRLKMTGLAIGSIPGFKILDLDQDLRYTIHVVDALLDLYPQGKQFYLLLGEDLVAHFDKWKSAEELVKKVPLLIGRRAHSSLSLPQSPRLKEAIEKGLTDTHTMDISSSEVRQRLKQGLYCGHLLHAKVVEYIKEYELYL